MFCVDGACVVESGIRTLFTSPQMTQLPQTKTVTELLSGLTLLSGLPGGLPGGLRRTAINVFNRLYKVGDNWLAPHRYQCV